MGARQSKRSVDITTTPKKEGVPVEGVVGDAAAPGDGKLEKIEETDVKPTTNGVAPHTDASPEDKDKDKDEATEKETEKEEETKAEDAKVPKVESPTTETPAEGDAEVTTPTEGTPASPTTATSPESKETKKKDKLKKKWSFRSISFGKKDKNKPARDDAPKNGDVTKEEPLAEGGEEAEGAEGGAAAVSSPPAEEKSTVSSPTEKEKSEEAVEATSEPAKPEEKKSPSKAAAAAAAASVASSPVEEKKDDNTTPAPTPVPTEANKTEDNQKEVEPAKADKTVEVSQVKAVIDAPVEVNSLSKQKANTATTAPSIIERKTSEDIPSQFPSSPPPTPIDPSPLQRAQQAAANATALAEALKLPAEAANKANIAYASGQNVPGGDTTSFPPQITCQTSELRPSTAQTIQSTETPDLSTVSVSHEQTGSASPETNIVTSDSDTHTPVVVPTEAITEEPNSSSSLITDTIADSAVADELLVTEPHQVQIPSATIDDNSVQPPEESDLVIHTEEGPIPVSDSVVVEAKPALVVPETPLEDDEKTVQVILEANVERDSCKLPTEMVESNEGLLVVTDEMIEACPEVGEALSEPIVTLVEEEEHQPNDEITEETADIPPPLPDSPIPLPKTTTQLLNFMSTQIEDSDVITEIVENPSETRKENIDKATIELIEIEELTDDQDDKASSPSSPRLEEASQTRFDLLSQAIEDDTDIPSPQSPEIPQQSSPLHISSETKVSSLENPTDDSFNPENSSFVPASSPIPQTPLTPPRTPSSVTNVDPANLCETSTGESTSLLELTDDQSNREFKMESLEQSLNSYNDSELELKERLAESMEENQMVNGQLTNDSIEENDQSKPEIEAPVENNVNAAEDISTTEVNDEAPMSPPPAVPAEAPAPILGPAITEDVASVTKAIEEIDINEKAVAAAVNENIESINSTNEIIADMNHQNNMNE
ncbi:A-kinase anchor protein 200-like [Venturia canescens]|uniref:A-kinase anchor protein 200-like n=1 Tax=Venturia canescens TaxID=32260 RepID=UPI001C9C76AE|nr:A-kinase anchor protein 200-like [Venturia canescens]